MTRGRRRMTLPRNLRRPVLHVRGAAEAEVARRAIRRVLAAGGDAVAVAVALVAQVRPAAGHLGLPIGRTLRVLARAVDVVGGAEPVGGPLPDVPGDVVQAVAIGRESVRRAGA